MRVLYYIPASMCASHLAPTSNPSCMGARYTHTQLCTYHNPADGNLKFIKPLMLFEIQQEQVVYTNVYNDIRLSISIRIEWTTLSIHNS